MNSSAKVFAFLFLLFLISSSILSQENIEKTENEIAQLSGKKKAEKYIEVISSQITRSPQSGIKLGEKALQELAPDQYPSERAKLLHLLGESYYLTGNFTKALPLLQQSANTYERLKDDDNLAQVYISLGRFYRKVQDDCENAEKYYHKAREIYENNKNEQELATVHNYLGNLEERCSKDLDKALSYYRMTEKYYTQVQDTIGLSYSFDFISQIFGQKEQYGEALDMQRKSLDLRLAIRDSFAIAISYTNLGEIYIMQKNLSKAQENFENAFQISGNLEYKDLNVHILGKLSEICLERKDYLCAYDYLKQQKELKDILLDEEKHKQLAEMKTKYETEKKELALEEEVIKNKNKTLLLLVLIGAILILVIIIALIAQRKKMDKQKSTIVNLQNLEAERTRIARDLHDNLGAELTMISSKLDIKAFRATNEADKRDLEDIRSISSNANFVLRETIWSIHKQELTVDELYRKAEEYANRILGGKEIRVAVIAFDKETILSPALALHLFRIIQESVNNASKYANCTELKIFISASKIEISDNGSGFDKEAVQKGYGLQNIEQRAKEINAAVSIESEKGKGTIILIEF